MRNLVFAKDTQCRRGNFKIGDALPVHLATSETIRQFREQFGEDVFVEQDNMSLNQLGALMQEIMASLTQIKSALGVEGAIKLSSQRRH